MNVGLPGLEVRERSTRDQSPHRLGVARLELASCHCDKAGIRVKHSLIALPRPQRRLIQGERFYN